MIVSLPRALSKLGYCSRKQGEKLIAEGKILVNGKIITDIHKRVNLNKDKISVEEEVINESLKIYIALNKPRGLITTRSDEKNRDTVFKCFANYNLPYIFPVGRLDKASEGLLLFTNDTQWANKILNPENYIEKKYHVKIDKIADEDLIKKLVNGFYVDGEFLNVKSAKIIRCGKKNCWLEIVLVEGKNRHIRRMLLNLGINVLRLIRISIGQIKLGNLEKGKFRYLTDDEIKSFK
ncbi:MAG: pseudouridine synthase [Melioribacter sp.]|uniref:pseudouridine synthase n=1 Tax=Rosettibacter primus TaxID=3111523 RepID=UPI00247D9729|nr:pseudouridine synthase [Melioribacter sp.]